MEEKVYLLCKKINESLKNDYAFKQLNEVEKEINNNDEVIKLAYKKDVYCSEYSDLLKIYKDDSKEVKESLKRLNEAKAALDNHPLVKKYLKLYSEAKQIMYEMNSILFGDYLSKECK